MKKVIWITGLSGSGKTTLANLLLGYLRSKKINPILLDGDQMRGVLGVSSDFTRETRLKNAQIYSNLAKILSEQGFTVIVSAIALFKETHAWNRENIKSYFQVYLDVPLSELFLRDPKGLYAKFNRGEIKNVAGLDLAIDPPKDADLVVGGDAQLTPDAILDRVIKKLDL